MANKEFAKYTASQTWDTTGGDFENAPDGDYVGLITSVEVKKSNSDFWMLVCKIKITEVTDETAVEFVGKMHFINAMFEGKKGWNPWRVKALFKELGLEIPEFAIVEDTLKEFIESGKVAVSFTIKTAKDFTNTKITEVIENYEDPNGDEGTVVEETVEEQTSELPSEEDINAMNKEECVAFAEEHGLMLNTKIHSKMKLALLTWLAEQTPEVIEEDGENETDDDSELKEKFVEFAASAGITDITDETSVEEAKEILGQYEFEIGQLSDEEKTFLIDNGLEGIIKKPAPKVAIKASVKVPTKAPAKK